MTPDKAPSSDVLEILLAHDAWGTRLILGLCRGLSREQFHQKFEIGLGSLHDNITHIIGAMRRWTDRLAGRELRPFLAAAPGFPNLAAEHQARSIDELLALLDDAQRDLAAVVAATRREGDRALGQTVSLDWPGDDGVTKRYTFTHAAVLVHVCTHGSHHRAQCLNMLRRLNVPGISDKLPDPSAVDWQAETEIPPVIVRSK